MADLTLLPPEIRGPLEDAIAHAHELQVTRYMAAAGIVIVFFELISSFSDEFDLIWKGRNGLERSVFLVHRPVVLIGLSCACHISAGLTTDLNNRACHVLLTIVGTLASVSTSLADGLVTIEVWQLWDFNTLAIRWMVTAYVIQSTSSLGFMSATLYSVLHAQHGHGGFVLNPVIRACVSSVSPKWFAGTWASGLVFEMMMFLAIIWNILDKPRAGHSPLFKLLLRDGCGYFVSVISLRTLNLVVALTSSPSGFLAPTFITWALVSVLVNRLVVNQSRERQRLRLSVCTYGDLNPMVLGSHILVSRTESYEMSTSMALELA